MRSNNEKLSALRIVDVARWRAKIIAALTREEGFMQRTADRLNIHRVTLQRWLADDAELRIAKRRIIKDAEQKEAT